MSQLMSETLDKATPRHIINMIKTLCTRDSKPAPDMHYHYERIRWLRNNYQNNDINWADQQVKNFHREQGISYRALEGRGRPVGAKNRNKANVSKNYFDRFKSPEVMQITSSDTIEDTKTDDTYELPEDSSDNAHPSTELANLKYKIDTVRYDLDNLSNDRKRDSSVLASALMELRNNIADNVVNISNLIARVNNIVENRPTIIELKRPDNLPNIQVGIQHKNFPLLLKAANARNASGHHLNLWLFGPAGTGKTTAAEKIAEIFELEFHYNGALSTAFQLTGYMDANGNYVSTAFRRAWEHGGVYLFDEIDGSMPDALLSMNGALANSIASFPDKMVPRHKDCIIIAGANTTGLGGGIEYVGAMKQNAAFLNRFVFIPWPHDNALEDALCSNKEWLARVREVRERIATKQIKSHLITMRASLFGASLLNAGVDWTDVEEMTLKCGMTDAQWGMVK